jgi:predicted TIM-barrel fold metal-dependent hydrolase
MDILDPTIATERESIDYVPRPTNLQGLRIGLIENTKKNSEAVLRKVAEKLKAVHGMTVDVLVHKSQRASLKDSQIQELQGKTDFAILGVGD